jgi:predicted Fe-Mo cluster-binding NifX family protein
MRVCFPVASDQGIDSIVFNHFGSAPTFIIVDTDSDTILSVNNRDQHHSHGACNPLAALAGNTIDAIVVGGIGAGAIAMLNRAQVKVFQSQAETIRENVTLFKNGNFRELVAQTCGGHGHGCSHS